MMPKLLPLLGTAAMLCACEARIGNDAPPVADNSSAAGKAEEGKVTIEAPGFNMSIDIPEGVRAHSDMDDENGLIYPGSTFSGVHVVGRPEGPDGNSEGEVELRFSTGDGTDRVVAWYRDPARNADFTVQSVSREGNGFAINGTSTGEGNDGQFTLRVTPRAGGGTEGRMVLSDRSH